MELLIIAATWPLLVLVGGFVFIVLMESFDSWYFYDFAWLLIWPIIIIAGIAILVNVRRAAKAGRPLGGQAARRVVVTYSLAILIPLFIRQLIIAADSEVFAVIAGLIIGFAVLTWGIFIKGRKVVAHATLIGGVLTILYVYTQLWQLGEGMRIAAAAVGLVVAVVLASVKFKNKLIG